MKAFQLTQLLKYLHVNNNSYRRFMALNGKLSGSGNGMYTSAYRFFEALRLHEGRPKGKKRQGAEKVFGSEGRKTGIAASRQMYSWCPPDMIFILDEWGKPKFVPKPTI